MFSEELSGTVSWAGETALLCSILLCLEGRVLAACLQGKGEQGQLGRPCDNLEQAVL